MSRNLSQRKKSAVLDSPSEAGRMTGGARRQQLIDVAIRLFSQKGFRGTTTKEIALAARVNEAIIFRHFATKDDLYTAILEHKAGQMLAEEWLGEFKQHAAKNEDEALLRSLARRIIEHHRRDNDFLRLMLYSALEGHELARSFIEKQDKPINEFFYGYIARRQREGAFRCGQPKAIMHAFMGMIYNHVLTSRLFDLESARIADKEVEKSFPALFLDGLRAAPASKAGRK